MPRTATIAAAVAVMMAVAPPLAHGQSTANHVLPGQLRATALEGATVYDRNNANVGDIKDIIIDKDGRVAVIILNVGAKLGLGGRYVAISFSDLLITGDSSNTRPHVTVNMTRDQLMSAQAFDLSDKVKPSGSSPPPAEDYR